MGASKQRTGYVEWRGGEWKTRVRDVATKKLVWVSLEADAAPADKLTQEQHALAQQLAIALQEQWELGGYVPLERQLTVNEFFVRWCDSRRSRYPGQVDTDERAFRLWISQELGTLPVRAVTREHLIAFSHYLDVKAAEGADFGGKRARNIFAVVSAMFRDAYKSKDPAIRILSENPCDDVPWPEKPVGDPIFQLLYPREFLAVVSCPLVPVVRSRLYAVALYTETRIGEARVLECSHIDIANGLVKILKAADRKTKGRTKLTKSNRSRITTLESALAPLLFQMVKERGANGRLFPDRPSDLPKGNQHRRIPVDHIPGTSKVCEVFRRDLRAALKWAGIPERPELFDDSDLRASHPIRFHELRASGITWRHARGDNPSVIRQECGHEDVRTNEIYIRRLRELRPGDLFPELPDRLLGEDAKAVRSAVPKACPVGTTISGIPEESGAGGGSRRFSRPSENGRDCEELGSEAALRVPKPARLASRRHSPERVTRRPKPDVQTFVAPLIEEALQSALLGDERGTLAPLAKAAKALVRGRAPKAKRSGEGR